MDGWIKLLKMREKILFTYVVHKKQVRDLHAADVRYHFDCWLGVYYLHIAAA